MVIDSAITAVLAANDKMAIGALQAANEYYPVQNLNGLKVSGYTDEMDLNKPYLKEQVIFATVNEQMTAPNCGLWKAVRQVRPQPPISPWANNSTALLSNTAEAITICQPWYFRCLPSSCSHTCKNFCLVALCAAAADTGKPPQPHQHVKYSRKPRAGDKGPADRCVVCPLRSRRLCDKLPGRAIPRNRPGPSRQRSRRHPHLCESQ